MRIGALVMATLVAGCTLTPEGAPVWYKTSKNSDAKFDGVDLSVICELADRLGSDYTAPDLTREDIDAMPDMWGQLEMLSLEGVSCRRPDDVLDLPFVSDPQRRLVSTWSEVASDGATESWASCLADTSRTAGDRVVFCEVAGAVAVPIEEQGLDLDPADDPHAGDTP